MYEPPIALSWSSALQLCSRVVDLSLSNCHTTFLDLLPPLISLDSNKLGYTINPKHTCKRLIPDTACLTTLIKCTIIKTLTLNCFLSVCKRNKNNSTRSCKLLPMGSVKNANDCMSDGIDQPTCTHGLVSCCSQPAPSQEREGVVNFTSWLYGTDSAVGKQYKVAMTNNLMLTVVNHDYCSGWWILLILVIMHAQHEVVYTSSASYPGHMRLVSISSIRGVA